MLNTVLATVISALVAVEEGDVPPSPAPPEIAGVICPNEREMNRYIGFRTDRQLDRRFWKDAVSVGVVCRPATLVLSQGTLRTIAKTEKLIPNSLL